MLRPQSVTHAGSEPACTPAALIGGGTRDAYGLEPRHPAARREARLARHSGVNDDAHSLDREARFGDRSREHDFPRPRRRWADGEILRLTRKGTVQRGDDDRRAVRPALFPENGLDATDLGGTGEKNEDVARLAPERLEYRGGDG